MELNEVAPPGWGHTKAEKEKTKPNKPKSKIGGTAAAFKRALDDGRFKGLPGDKTKKEKTASMFKLMWSMKKKGAKPHYKPGTDEKKKKYQEEGLSPTQDNNLFGNAYAGSKITKKKKKKNIKEEPERTAEYKAMQASLYPRGDAEGATAHRVGGWKKKRPRNVTTKRNRGYRKPAGARVHEGRVDASYSGGEVTYSSFYNRAREARKAMATKSAKKIEYDKRNDAVRADSRAKGIKFSDKKGTGRIVKGKKKYD